jgi:hypothetical protein
MANHALTLGDFKTLFLSGTVQYFSVEQITEPNSGFFLQLITESNSYLLHTQRGDVRIFTTIDAVYRVLKSISPITKIQVFL